MRRRLPTGDKSDYFCPLMKKFMQNRVYLLDYSSIREMLVFLNEGYEWIVDIDLEKFFDNVPQDRLVT